MKTINCKSLSDVCELLLDGEPVFIIRAQDAAAVTGIKANIEESKRTGAQNIIRAEAQLARIIAWQKKNGKKVRAAD
jgi:hypothetical protein